MDLKQLEYFRHVAELGSFAEAARRLRLSPAKVTRAVARLEDQLGLALLNRTSRSVRLTERGALYLDSCKQILAEIEGAERRVRGEDATPRGMLTVLLMRMQETDTSDENIKDLVGEVANTISGNARRDFGKSFVISVPVVIAHDSDKVTTPHPRSFVIPINWRTHSAKLVVCLE